MKRFNWKLIPVASLVMLFMMGCAATAHIEKDPSADFTAYRSFAWMERDSVDHRTELTERQIRYTVSRELEKLGFRESRNKPDLLVGYDLLVERGTRRQSDAVYSQPHFRPFYNPYTRRWGTIYFPSQYLGTESYQVPVTEGTITITLVEAKTDRTIWQGWATDVVNSRHLTDKEINTTVRTILKKLR